MTGKAQSTANEMFTSLSYRNASSSRLCACKRVSNALSNAVKESRAPTMVQMKVSVSSSTPGSVSESITAYAFERLDHEQLTRGPGVIENGFKLYACLYLSRLGVCCQVIYIIFDCPTYTSHVQHAFNMVNLTWTLFQETISSPCDTDR